MDGNCETTMHPHVFIFVILHIELNIYSDAGLLGQSSKRRLDHNSVNESYNAITYIM